MLSMKYSLVYWTDMDDRGGAACLRYRRCNKGLCSSPAVGWGIRVGVLLSFRIEQRVQGVGYLVRQDV